MPELAKRVQQLPPYLFVNISRAIAAKKVQGIDVVSFGIGDPGYPDARCRTRRIGSWRSQDSESPIPGERRVARVPPSSIGVLLATFRR